MSTASIAADAEKERKRAVSLIESLSNKNSPPLLVGKSAPVFSRDFDSAAYENAAEAFIELKKNESSVVWDELVTHCDDSRYSLTIAGEIDERLKNRSVGNICHFIAFHQLVDPARYRLRDLRVSRPVTVNFDPDFELTKWRSERADKPLWELQAEVLSIALRQVPDFNVELDYRRGGPRETADQIKQRVRDAIEADIAKLQETQTPIFEWQKWDSIHIVQPKKTTKRIRGRLKNRRQHEERAQGADE